MAPRTTIEEHVAASNRPKLGEVFSAIASAAREIAKKIRLAGLSDTYGAFGVVNVQGEQQQKLDVFANDAMMQELGAKQSVAALVSEEDEGPVLTGHEGAEFIVIFDPLDGSSNIDVNVNVGTIFSVQQHREGTLEQAMLQAGSRQVAAGYVVYGPSTMLVMSTGADVAGFTMDDSGTFVRSSDAMKMPEQGPYYSANEANAASWPAVYRDYLAMLLRGEMGGTPYSARYIGSLVADFHRTLLKGGVFLYPPTDKAPKGKLRLLYEANPLAMLAAQAGGAAVSGPERILDVAAEQIHQRTPFIVGSKREVEALHKAVLEAQS